MKKVIVLALAAIMVLSVAGAAFADISTLYTDVNQGTPGTVEGTVNVSASVKPKITLQITTTDDGQTLAFGDLYPGDDTTDDGKSVTLAVQSNKKYTLTRDDTGMSDITDAKLVPSAPSTGINGATEHDRTDANGTPATHIDAFNLGVVGWDAEPGGPYTGTIVYTALQK